MSGATTPNSNHSNRRNFIIPPPNRFNLRATGQSTDGPGGRIVLSFQAGTFTTEIILDSLIRRITNASPGRH